MFFYLLAGVATGYCLGRSKDKGLNMHYLIMLVCCGAIIGGGVFMASGGGNDADKVLNCEHWNGLFCTKEGEL